jgi:phage tail-like protein
VLTPLEDRIAASYLLTDPRTTPDDALDWLASWVGIAFEPGYPADRRREHLERAAELSRTRGTLRGFNAALDVATGGGVRRGEVVAVEDFRFRRTLATILGASTIDATDPLLQGLAVSGNSVVGETLFLGDERQREFLALFRADPKASEAQIDALLGQLAHRVTVLVHDAVRPLDLGLIRRVAEVETPAHVAWRLETASAELVVGMAALVGIDTYLGPPEPPAPATLGVTFLGEGDRVQHPPRLDGGRPMLPPERPVARANVPEVVVAGDPFPLDASASFAPPGRRVATYRWTYLGPA